MGWNEAKSNWSTYVDATETCAMASGHVLVQALDSVGTSEFSELFIHVVRATARVVTNPNAKVLHFERFALVNLMYPHQSLCRIYMKAIRRTVFSPTISPFVFLTFFSLLLKKVLIKMCSMRLRWRNSPEEVPEPTLGNDFIGCKDSHAVKLRVGLIGSGEVAAHDLVFHETHDTVE